VDVNRVADAGAAPYLTRVRGRKAQKDVELR
jgi:hypothetical protein